MREVSVLDLSRSVRDEVLAVFLRPPHLDNLRGLDLSNNALTDASIPALLDSGLLSRLCWLDLRNNAFSAEGAARLAGAVQQGWIDLHGHEPSPGLPNLAWVGQRPGRLVNSISMDLALIPAGSFLMGADPEPDFEEEEGPLHEVEITRPFYLGVYPVTQLQYQELMGLNPSEFQQAGPNARHRPVEEVSWHDAVDFCRRLSRLPEEKRAGRVYRLPTEAEWEYACRVGTTTPYWFGQEASGVMANFDGLNFARRQGPFLQTTTPVGRYPANGFGLCDIVGNVWEWCQDWYSSRWYRRSGRRNPRGPSRGSQRVCRGGCWNGAGVSCRSARRLGEEPDVSDSVTGFRVALSLPAGSAG
jgi:formylglycine-generating enzyme required for sulfatase activity